MRKRKLWVGLAAGLLGTVLLGGIAVADADPLTGTWHQRDSGTSNIFYFISEPVGGVYPVVYYDDYTGLGVCGDNGPMLWSGFVTETDPNVFEGSFGEYWCPDNGDGVEVDLLGLDIVEFEPLVYDPATDTISGGLGGCVGERQDRVDNPNEAAEEIAEGEYPPPDPEAAGC
jgi:hypothetical protein